MLERIKPMLLVFFILCAFMVAGSSDFIPHLTDWLMVIFTGVLAIYAVIQARILNLHYEVFTKQEGWMKYQANKMEQTIGEMQVAAKAAQEANYLTRFSWQHDRRPSIRLKEIQVHEVTPWPSPEIVFVPVWENVGRMPTEDALTEVWIKQITALKQPPDPVVFEDRPGSAIQLGPGGSVGTSVTMEKTDCLALTNRNTRYFLCGWVKYDDIYEERLPEGERQHLTKICLEIHMRNGISRSDQGIYPPMNVYFTLHNENNDAY